MAQYPPPTENLPIFDPNQFIHDTQGLTRDEADQLYVHYPTAQGAVEIPSLTAPQIQSTILNVSNRVDCQGDMYCQTLNYVALNPPIPEGETPTLNQVLIAGSNAGGHDISNVLNLETTSTTAQTLYIGSDTGLVNAMSYNTDLNCIELTGSFHATIKGDYIAPNGNIQCNRMEYNTLVPPGGKLATSLYSFWNEPTDSIATTSLEPSAQTALELSTINNQQISVLQVNALQQANGTYQGLPATTLTLDGSVIASDIDLQGFKIAPNLGTGNVEVLEGTDLSNMTMAQLTANTIVVQPTIPAQATMAIYNEDDQVKIINQSTSTAGDLLVNTLHYTALDPPIAPATIPNLSQVLTEGNLASQSIDMNGFSILNSESVYTNNVYAVNENGLRTIYTNNLVVQNGIGDWVLDVNNQGNLVSSGDVKGTTLTADTCSWSKVDPQIDAFYTASGIQCDGQIACNSTISTNGELIVNNSNLSVYDPSTNAVFQANTGQNKILSTTNADIEGFNNLLLNGDATCNVLHYTTLDPPIVPASTPNLNQVLTQGNNAYTNIIMNGSDIKTALSVEVSRLKPNPETANPDDINVFGNLIMSGATPLTQRNISNAYDITASHTIQSTNTGPNASFSTNSGEFRVLGNGQTYCNNLTTTNGLNVQSGNVLISSGTIASAGNLFRVDTSGNVACQQLSYQSLNPPIPTPATPTLSDVLTAGNTASQNIDMNTNNIFNATGIYVNDILTAQNPSNTTTTTTNILNIGLTNEAPTTTINSDAINTNTIIASGDVSGLTLTANTCVWEKDPLGDDAFHTTSGVYCDGQLYSKGVFSCDSEVVVNNANISLYNPSFGAIFQANTPLNKILSTTNADIEGFNNILANGDITCNVLNYTTLNPAIPTPTTPTLSQVMTQGNTASTDLNMSNHNITNTALINGVSPQFKPSYDYWVSPNGNNTTGLGTILSPYQTIQKAIDQCELVFNGTPRVVHILQGNYTENLTISKSRINFAGQNPNGSRADTGCSINGAITINCTTDNTDMNNNNIYFSDLQINGSILNISSTKNRVSIANCYIYGNDQLMYFNNSNDYRFFMNNCNLSNETAIATNEMLLFSGSGMISITNCTLTQKGLGNVIHFNGSSRVDTFAQNILTNDNTSSNIQALLKLSSASNKAIGNCAFVFSSSTAKSTASPNFSTGILFNTPLNSLSVLSLFNNIFSLAGTGGGNTDYAVNQVNANSSVVLYGNNKSTSSNAGLSAHTIVGTNNATKFAMQDVA